MIISFVLTTDHFHLLVRHRLWTDEKWGSCKRCVHLDFGALSPPSQGGEKACSPALKSDRASKVPLNLDALNETTSKRWGK